MAEIFLEKTWKIDENGGTVLGERDQNRPKFRTCPRDRMSLILFLRLLVLPNPDSWRVG